MAVTFFEDAYKTRGGTSIEDQILGSNSYPTMFDLDKNEELYKAVNLEEVHSVLKSFTKDECPGLDEWMVEIFLHFFYLMGPDLVRIVEESGLGGHIIGAINSTYIALIPKNGESGTFTNYMTMSLCNLLYKLISKIIALIIKHTLSTYISPEKYGFLQDKLIHDVVATTQECMHSIRTKNMEVVVMKVDLQKTYDNVD